MPNLTDAQLIILSAAAQRPDRNALPLPRSIRMSKAALAKEIGGLLKHQLLVEQPVPSDAESWRQDKDGQPVGLTVTDAGLRTIEGEPPAATKRPAASPKRGRPATPPRQPAEAGSPLPRPGTKLALLINLLSRKNGATIAEAVKATNWQPHSVRGAISGALKKKLALTVTSDPADRRGRVDRISPAKRVA